MKIALLILLAGLMAACAPRPPKSSGPAAGRNTTVIDSIQDVLLRQETGWNNGSIDQYMEGYARSDSTRFLSGGRLTRGWKTVRDQYAKAYPDKKTMGTLKFSEINIEPLSPAYAIVYGKWELTRAKDHPWGRFTLLFHKLPEGWRIVHDHTSLAK